MIPRKHIEKGHLTILYITSEPKIWTNDTHDHKKVISLIIISSKHFRAISPSNKFGFY